MTALAILLATGLVAACSGLVTFALLNRKDHREVLAIRDLLDHERVLSRQYQMERDIEVAAHAVTRSQLEETRERLSMAEAQRNSAYRDVRAHYVERIKNAPIADAGKLLELLLATPFPPVRLPQRAEASGGTANDSDLEKP
jgi:hypothetical protein